MNPVQAIKEYRAKLNQLGQVRMQLMNQLKQLETQMCECQGVIKFIDAEMKKPKVKK